METTLAPSAATPATPSYAISFIYYSRGNSELGDDPSHVGLAVHEDVPLPSTCHLHHVRCPTHIRYMYEPRPKQPLATDTLVWGRSTIVGALPSQEATRANEVLGAFGAVEASLPEWNAGNCQNWTVDAVGVLEDKGILSKGERVFWAALIGKGAEEAGRRCLADGRVWIVGEHRKPTTNVDAKWGSGEPKTVGKLAGNSAMKDRMKALERSMTTNAPKAAGSSSTRS